jgi:hypothetical protein
LILGEKHVHTNNLKNWTSNTATNAENFYCQDGAYINSANSNWGDAWHVRTFHDRLNTNTYGIAKGPNDRATNEPNTAGFGSWHPGICQFLLGDGSVTPIKVTAPVGFHTNKSILLMLSCIDDGGVLQLE